MMQQISVKEIIDFLGSNVIQVFGNHKNLYVKYLKPVADVDEYTLDWIHSMSQDKQVLAENSRAKVILTDHEVQYSQTMNDQNKVLIIVQNPKLSLLKIGNCFFIEKVIPGIHESAVIHPMAEIGNNFYAGPNVALGVCKIGDNVILHSNVVINDGVIIGNHVTIKPGAVLGFDGFGYERDEHNNLVKFPQVGRLMVHDHVDIGAGCCIDRGSLSDTVIGFNSKINNLCRIAHNVVIGKNVVLAGHVNVSGSTIIEDDIWVAPCVCFRGHQTIGKGATLGMGAVVTKNVPPGETWVGNPARKMEK